MAIEDIKRELEQRFDAPLDEFYKRRIIFWNDEDGDFKEHYNQLWNVVWRKVPWLSKI